MKNNKHILQYFPRKHLMILGALFCALLFVLLLPAPSASSERTSVALDLSSASLIAAIEEADQALEEQNNLEAEKSQWRWIEETVRNGDNLSAIFQRAKVSSSAMYRLLENPDYAKQLRRIFPGQKFRFALNLDEELSAIQYIISHLEYVDFNIQEDGQFFAEHIKVQPDVELSYRTATIDDSLFLAGQKAGIPQNLIMQLADIFSGVIDFVYDPRKGDSFDLLYEEKYIDGVKVGTGNLLAASYNGRAGTYTAFRYDNGKGKVGYYNADGVSMRKAFLRAPLDFTRISSNFNPGRLHPVFKTTRPHRGIDYAAPTGTPVFAAGDGRVTHSGYNAANGNYVFIAHGTAYVTKYLHLHKRYVKAGQQVKQRTVIGSVGATGYATGPHLHYEFLVNGVHRNPRTILDKLPSAEPIVKTELARFQEKIHSLQLQYNHRQQLIANN